MKHVAFALFLSLGITYSTAQAQTSYSSQHHNFTVTEIVEGLEKPWGLAFLPNGDMLVTESKRKQLRLIQNGKLHPKPITGLPKHIDTGGQGGLLDITLHPQFNKNQWVYFSYSGTGKGGIGTEVARGRLINHRLIDVEIIFKASPKTSGSLHYGSRLVFAADSTLFITIGERYQHLEEAQNPENHLGSIIRINDDGSIPHNNPFTNHPNYQPEIYSYGHRNPQGLALRSSDKTMWMHEHGPRGGDEVNILNKAGANYGWPAITYGIDYSGAIISDKTHSKGMEQPVVYWKPSIAPSGMTFYNGRHFPKWQDNLFVGALKGKHLRRLTLKGNKITGQEVVLTSFGRIRDVVSAPDSYLYFITDAHNGKILRLEPRN